MSEKDKNSVHYSHKNEDLIKDYIFMAIIFIVGASLAFILWCMHPENKYKEQTSTNSKVSSMEVECEIYD